MQCLYFLNPIVRKPKVRIAFPPPIALQALTRYTRVQNNTYTPFNSKYFETMSEVDEKGLQVSFFVYALHRLNKLFDTIKNNNKLILNCLSW